MLLSKAMYRFDAIPIKIPITLFVGIEKPIVRFTWNLKGPRTAKTFLKKNKTRALLLPDFTAHYKSYGNKKCGVSIKTDMRNNGTEYRELEINP